MGRGVCPRLAPAACPLPPSRPLRATAPVKDRAGVTWSSPSYKMSRGQFGSQFTVSVTHSHIRSASHIETHHEGENCLLKAMVWILFMLVAEGCALVHCSQISCYTDKDIYKGMWFLVGIVFYTYNLLLSYN